jgi:hypothetical protein
MGPFVAASYVVTAQELDHALEECNKVKLVRGLQVPLREKTAATMPFISFPWLFPRELGIIANKGAGPKEDLAGLQAQMAALSRKPKKPDFDPLGGVLIPEPLSDVQPCELSSIGDQSSDMPLELRNEDFARQTAEDYQLPSFARSLSPLDESGTSAALTLRQLSVIDRSQSRDNDVTNDPTASTSKSNATVALSSCRSEDVERKVTKDAEEAEDEDEEDSGEAQ